VSAAGAATMSGVDATFVGAMEAVAARSVPAAEVPEIGGWMARCSPGLATKRLNSVRPRAHDRYPEHERTAPRAAVRIDPVPPSGWWATCQASLGASSVRRAAVAALL
jgi:hypothetical protein